METGIQSEHQCRKRFKGVERVANVFPRLLDGEFIEELSKGERTKKELNKNTVKARSRTTVSSEFSISWNTLQKVLTFGWKTKTILSPSSENAT